LYSQYHYSGSFGSLAGGFLPLFKGVFHLKISGIILTLLITLISHNLWLKLLRFCTRYPYTIENWKTKELQRKKKLKKPFEASSFLLETCVFL